MKFCMPENGMELMYLIKNNACITRDLGMPKKDKILIANLFNF